MATAELAACLPVLLLLVAAVLAAVAVVSAHVRAQDAAREAARAAARGDRAVGVRLAGAALHGARVTTSLRGGVVVTTVSTSVRPLGGLQPSITVTEHATAALEPGVAGSG